MELGIQHLVGNPALIQHLAEQFGSLNGNGAHQDRLSLLMGLCNLLHNRFVLFLLGLIYCIIQILTDHRPVGRDGDDVHSVNVTELLFLCQGSTCHTRLLGIFIKEVLEGNSSQGTALTAHVHMLLGLNGLMESV